MKKKPYLFILLIFVCGLLIVPVTKERGYIHQGTYTPYEKTLGVAPIWTVGYSVEVREGNYNSEMYDAVSVHRYLHGTVLVLITLSYVALTAYRFTQFKSQAS